MRKRESEKERHSDRESTESESERERERERFSTDPIMRQTPDWSTESEFLCSPSSICPRWM